MNMPKHSLSFRLTKPVLETQFQLLDTISPYNLFAVTFSTMPRTHKRNKAEALEDNNLNFSINLNRFSFGCEFSGPLTLRLSNGKIEEPNDQLHKHKLPDPKDTPQHHENHNVLHLSENLKQLQEKLIRAKKQLKNNKKTANLRQTMDTTTHHPRLLACKGIDDSTSTLNAESKTKFQQMLKQAKRNKDYFVGTMIKSITTEHHPARKYLNATITNMRNILAIERPSVFELEHRKVNIERKPTYHGCKTILLELENTLLLWNKQKTNPDDLQIGKGDHKNYITLRPYALSFLKRIAAHFEIIIYTRMDKALATNILEELDPDNKIISGVLSSESCCLLQGNLLSKDLRILNRNPRDTLILESDLSSVIQVANLVPLIPFSDDNDKQLMQLQRFLIRQASKCSDVRELCRNWFKLQKYWQFQSDQQLIQELYL